MVTSLVLASPSIAVPVSLVVALVMVLYYLPAGCFAFYEPFEWEELRSLAKKVVKCYELAHHPVFAHQPLPLYLHL